MDVFHPSDHLQNKEFIFCTSSQLTQNSCKDFKKKIICRLYYSSIFFIEANKKKSILQHYSSYVETV